MKNILIQGAMEVETDYLIEQVKKLDGYEYIKENDLDFHSGTDGVKKYIISITGMGTVSAAMATAYALSRFQPQMVINQGMAGAQVRELTVGDLILADKAVNINQLSMPKKKLGEGSDPFTWDGFHTKYYSCDAALMETCMKAEYTSGRVIHGSVATGDIFSREDDRIVWLTEKFHTSCEDMETAAVYKVCEAFGVPCVGMRVISNNELLDQELNEESAQALQQYVWHIVKDYV